MNAWVVTAVVLFGLCAMAAVGTTEDALAKQLQVVTSRGNVFSLLDSEVGWMNNGTGNFTIINYVTNNTIINNTGSGTGAGALGTSGRVVSIPYNGLLLYGDTQGAPGTIKPAESFNWYNGTIDYVGFIPKHSVPTRYAWESPYGQYLVSGNELTNFGNTRYSIDAIGSRTLEGNVATVRDYSQSIEADVAGKTVIKLDRSGFGNRALINVDASAADVTAQVVTSTNDLLNTPYRDFNGTGKFVFFEAETMRNAERIISMGYAQWRCGDYQGDSRYKCYNNAGQYAVTYSSLHNGYLKYFKFNAGTQTAIPFTADLYVSDVDEAFVDSNITTTVKYGNKGYHETVVSTRTLDSVVTATSAFSDGMWHVTSFWQETAYSVSFQWSRQGTTYTAAASGTAAGEGILRVTDAAPYVVRGNVDPFSSKGAVIQTDSDIYVVLEGTGTVIINASEVYESDDVDVYGLPSNVPWVLETQYGETLHAGLTKNGRITIPVPENYGEGVYEVSLSVYDDEMSYRVGSDDVLLDLVNEKAVRIDFDDPTRNLIYIPSNYMRYPMTASVDIDDVRLAKIRDDCSSIEQQRLNFLSKEYSSGSTMHVPFIPGMSALKMTIDDTDTCIKFEDVVPQVQLSVMRGESRSATNSSLVDLTVNSRSSIILASNDPVSVSISFGGSGFSEQSRRTYTHDAHMSNPATGNTFTCTNATPHGGGGNAQPPHCPQPAKTILNAAANINLASTMDHYFTKYEITVDLFKNGELYDSSTLPINSLNAVPPVDIVETFGLGIFYTGRDNSNILIEPIQSNSTTVTGGHGTQFFNGYSHPSSISYHSIAGTSWSETFTRTFDIQGSVGDQFDIRVSNNILFSFPVPYGHHNYYAGEMIYNWPPVFETSIANGTPFLGGVYTQMIVPANSYYGPNDRGVFVGLNDGFVIVTPKS